MTGQAHRGHTRRGAPARAPRIRLDLLGELDAREQIGRSIPRPSAPFTGITRRFPFVTDRAEAGHAFRTYGVQPTFLHFDTLVTDPRASRAILETLHVQHEALATLMRFFGLPPLPAMPYVLGAPPLPPWAFFPPADTPVISRAPPAATSQRPPRAPTVDGSAARRELSPIATPTPDSSPPVPVAQAASAQAIWRPIAQRPISHLSSLQFIPGAADFDPETDDLLD